MHKILHALELNMTIFYCEDGHFTVYQCYNVKDAYANVGGSYSG